jgi:recombination protein RecT
MSEAAISNNARPVDAIAHALKNVRVQEQLRSVLPKHLTPDRMVKVALTAITSTPDLQKCTIPSIIMAIVRASELGLEPSGALGHAYLVPYYNGQKRQHECQMIPGYRGLISLARRSGEIVSISSYVVHEGDEFEFELGLDPKLRHVPSVDENPGPMKFAYAVAKLKDGGVQFEVMSIAQINRVRDRGGRARGSNTPWVTDYEEMARKTVLRRLFKYLPVSVELVTAAQISAKADGDDVFGNVIDGALDADEAPAEKAPARAKRGMSVVRDAAAASAGQGEGEPSGAAEPYDPETGEVLSQGGGEREPGADG